MTEKLTKFDAAEYLETDEDIALFLSEALKTGDSAYINRTIGTIARARGMTDIARQSGIKREALYKALSENGNPQFTTVHAVIKALGFNLTVSAN
ncbi:addiction module antidote protein [Pelagibius sp. Alg239-R121]|uniref:addiction module antidote protein n=1 Tax=Pelagibius sp. Alg239-R121 TaxID=2993448 RepID=UPI0024A6AD35|nr:addiction module antidote protein [Pelagibius sp. Alg239-R121]